MPNVNNGGGGEWSEVARGSVSNGSVQLSTDAFDLYKIAFRRTGTGNLGIRFYNGVNKRTNSVYGGHTRRIRNGAASTPTVTDYGGYTFSSCYCVYPGGNATNAQGEMFLRGLKEAGVLSVVDTSYTETGGTNAAAFARSEFFYNTAEVHDSIELSGVDSTNSTFDYILYGKNY